MTSLPEPEKDSEISPDGKAASNRRQAASGGNDRFELWVECLAAEMQPLLERVAWTYLRDTELARDAVQETFALLVERPELQTHENVQGWLIKTVQLKSLELRRMRQQSADQIHRVSESLRDRAALKMGLGSSIDEGRLDASEHERQRQQRIEALRQAIATLPESQRQVVLGRLQVGKSFADIASELDIPLGTALSRMRLALQKLRTALTEDEAES